MGLDLALEGLQISIGLGKNSRRGAYPPLRCGSATSARPRHEVVARPNAHGCPAAQAVLPVEIILKLQQGYEKWLRRGFLAAEQRLLLGASSPLS